MDLSLGGRRALITGSTGAIGEAIARRLADEGAFVVIHGRSADRAGRVADAITAAGGTATSVTGDLTSEEAVAAITDTITAAFGGVDVLVNNAGGYSNSTWWSATPADWLGHYDTNVVSTVRLVQALTPAMRTAGFGRIIQIASGLATQPFPFIPEYGATKAAMVNLTVSLARELAGSGVTVNTVSPGLIRTPGIEDFYRRDAEARGGGSTWDVERVRAPVLILAGENDPRCPIRQIDNYLTKLAELGKTHEVYRFDAGHGSLVIEERIRQMEAELTFARKHLPL